MTPVLEKLVVHRLLRVIGSRGVSMAGSPEDTDVIGCSPTPPYGFGCAGELFGRGMSSATDRRFLHPRAVRWA